VSAHPDAIAHRAQRSTRSSRGQDLQESDQNTASTGLHIDHHRAPGAVIVRVSGALRFPAAVKLTHAVESLLDQGVTQVTVLDLGEVAEADHTGIAVVVAVGRDLKAAGSQVRVVTADGALLGRLPYTLGLRRTFASLPEALSFQG
jgi:MFS superfamily sulfate permease-like transporter